MVQYYSILSDHSDWQTDRQTRRQAGRQAGRHAHTHTHFATAELSQSISIVMFIICILQKAHITLQQLRHENGQEICHSVSVRQLS